MAVKPRDIGIGRLFESIRDAVVVADVDSGRIVLWNAAAAALFGHCDDAAVDQPLEMLIPERLRAQHRAGLARYRATGKGAYIGTPRVLEQPALRADGEEF